MRINKENHEDLCHADWVHLSLKFTLNTTLQWHQLQIVK